MDKKVMLVILDGWGLSPEETGNAPLLANTPNLDYIYSEYPKTSLSASGLEVGLSIGEPGNSEVGHLNIGSGRVVWENLPRIDQAIDSGEVAENPVLNEVIDSAVQNDKAIHFIGLVSDGGVHSHIRHLKALMQTAAKKGAKNIFVHFISDGRDTSPQVAERYATDLNDFFKEIRTGRIVSLIGRFYAMDRDNNWDREQKALDLYTKGTGEKFDQIGEAIKWNYDNNKTDEFFEPCVIGEGAQICDGDSIVMFNHRCDRARQMMHLLTGAVKAEIPTGLKVATMTEYENGQTTPAMFAPLNMEKTLPELLSNNNLTQFHTAETEKFAHVTYFLNAGREVVYKGEDDELVASKKVPSYDQVPPMSAEEVTEKVIEGINSETDFLIVNYANGDMVGHTGVLDAAISACEYVDKCLGQIMAEASKHGYRVFITADHGNCETMTDISTNTPNKEHTTNPVPFVFLNFEAKPYDFQPVAFTKDDYILYSVGTPIGVLADVAPSILANLGIAQPEEMTGMDLSVAMM